MGAIFDALFGGFETLVKEWINDIDNFVKFKLRKIKRSIMSFMIFMIFFCFGLIFLIIGTTMFISRFVPLDLVFLFGGLILVYVGILINMIK